MESDEEDVSLKQLFGSLKQTAKHIRSQIDESLYHMHQFEKNLKDEEVPTIPLRPTKRLRKWLIRRDLAVETSFSEFFDRFLQEHSEENRLDLSGKTIRMNADACSLFRIHEINPVVSLWDLLAKFPLLYT